MNDLAELNSEGAPRLVRRAFAVYRDQWRTLIGATAITVVPVSLLQAFLLRDVPDPLAATAAEDPQAAAVYGVFGAAYLVLITPLLAAIVLRGNAEYHARTDPSIEGLYSYGFSRLLTIVAITFLSGVAVALGFIAFVLPGIWLLGRLYLALPAAVVEGARAIGSLRRSWELTSGYVWRVLGTLLLAFLAMFAVTFAAQEIVRLIARVAGWALVGLLDGVVSSVVLPFGFVVSMLLYLDARVREDDLTRERLAVALAPGRAPQAD